MEVPRVPAQLGFSVRLRTRWSDEDTQAVLNNAVYLTLLEEARYAYFAGLNLLRANHFPFVLAQTNVRFLAPGRGGMEVDVALATTRVGKSSFEQVYRVSEVGAGPLCEAQALLVGWDSERAASRALDADFRQRVSDFEGG